MSYVLLYAQPGSVRFRVVHLHLKKNRWWRNLHSLRKSKLDEMQKLFFSRMETIESLLFLDESIRINFVLFYDS